jgi:hypothetical protein
MILVREDDGCLHVYDSLDAVALSIEGIDAEDTLRAVFDEDGQRYRIDWIRPNRRSGWFGVENGLYRLVPDGAPDPGALLDLVRTSEILPEHAPAIRAIEERLVR